MFFDCKPWEAAIASRSFFDFLVRVSIRAHERLMKGCLRFLRRSICVFIAIQSRDDSRGICRRRSRLADSRQKHRRGGRRSKLPQQFSSIDAHG